MLVLVGILAALVAILVPVFAGIRQSARDVVCAARLRDLTFACASYLHDNDSYPQLVRDTQPLPASPAPSPLSMASGGLQPMPQNGQTRLFNDLACYLRFPKIAGGVAAVDLPPALQCPGLEAVEDGRGPLAVREPGNFSYFTGYDYLAGLEGATGTALKAGRAAGTKGGGRAVLWSDDVRLSFASGASATSAAAGSAAPLSGFSGNRPSPWTVCRRALLDFYPPQGGSGNRAGALECDTGLLLPRPAPRLYRQQCGVGKGR